MVIKFNRVTQEVYYRGSCIPNVIQELVLSASKLSQFVDHK